MCSSTRQISKYLLLISIASLAIFLSIYQWIELIHVRTGGTNPFCSLSEKINCTAVWNSSLADKIHALIGIPFAGLGTVWASMVFIMGIELIILEKKNLPPSSTILALRLTTGAGVITSIVLLAYSIHLGVLCLTCLLFYSFVILAAFIVFRLPKYQNAKWSKAIFQSLGLLVALVALLFYPGLKTPVQSQDLVSLDSSHKQSTNTYKNNDLLKNYLLSLPPEVQQHVSDARAMYREASSIDRSVDGKRLIYGNAQAPVHLIEWVDISCSHCKHLEETLAQIRRISPPNSWSEEGRHFPIDSECNPNVNLSRGTHIDCLAAKIMICLGGSPEGQRIRANFFKKQGHLNIDEMWEIAAGSPTQRKILQACTSSQTTNKLLQDDINLAEEYHIKGTPLVVINGSQAVDYAPFIYAMILAGGNSNAAGFNVLPAPQKKAKH